MKGRSGSPARLFIIAERKDYAMNDKPSPEKIQRINKRLEGFLSMKSARTDPQGMYTGVPENPYEKPVQDADDL